MRVWDVGFRGLAQGPAPTMLVGGLALRLRLVQPDQQNA